MHGPRRWALSLEGYMMERIHQTPIPFNRRLWFAFSVAFFASMGSVRVFEFFGPPESLFSWWACFPAAVSALLDEPAPFRMEYAFFILLLASLTVIYAAVSLACGWTLVAICGFARVIIIRRRRETQD